MNSKETVVRFHELFLAFLEDWVELRQVSWNLLAYDESFREADDGVENLQIRELAFRYLGQVDNVGPNEIDELEPFEQYIVAEVLFNL